MGLRANEVMKALMIEELIAAVIAFTAACCLDSENMILPGALCIGNMSVMVFCEYLKKEIRKEWKRRYRNQ